MKKTILYAVVQVTPKESPILETEKQEREYKDRLSNDIKFKLSGYDTDIRFVLKIEK